MRPVSDEEAWSAALAIAREESQTVFLKMEGNAGLLQKNDASKTRPLTTLSYRPDANELLVKAREYLKGWEERQEAVVETSLGAWALTCIELTESGEEMLQSTQPDGLSQNKEKWQTPWQRFLEAVERWDEPAIFFQLYLVIRLVELDVRQKVLPPAPREWLPHSSREQTFAFFQIRRILARATEEKRDFKFLVLHSHPELEIEDEVAAREWMSFLQAGQNHDRAELLSSLAGLTSEFEGELADTEWPT